MVARGSTYWFFGLLTLLPAVAGAAEYIPDEKKDHWAWQKPVRPPVPSVRSKEWVRNPIDAFILARLEAAGLRPAAPASRAQLVRRVTLDLIGLPPTPEEIEQAERDPSATWWEQVVDRLLASPHYGERWGRHWLDVARFAESNGYEFDEIRPDAWRYRDYVIRSFNDDKPYDRFVKEQLAGDELYPGDRDALIATAFNLLGPDMTDASSQAQRRQNTLNDMTDTAGLVFLGLTITCARCHDHKFEPIPQSDYYRLQAFFAAADFRHDVVIADAQEQARHERQQREYEALVKPIRDQIAALEEPHRRRLFEARLARLTPEAQAAHRTPAERRTESQRILVAETARLVAVSAKHVTDAMSAAERSRWQALHAELRKYDAYKPVPLAVTMAMQENGSVAPKTFILERGELNSPADEVEAGFPTILTPGLEPRPAAVTPQAQSTGRRSALAQWVASADNPLTARVLVNRLWQHHFGRGLVATANDFGTRGEPPSHPELLDWLAVEFVERGWSIKAMHRLMLTSATYQQSTLGPKADIDPENRLLGRMNRLRLEGEVIRDSLLAVSGRLNRQIGGPSVFPPIPREALQGSKGWTASTDPADHVRRSVYIFARRNLRFPLLEVFDLPDSNQSCARRERSTTAPQALALLNADEVTVAAQALAERLEREATSVEARIDRAFRLVLGRPPTRTELTTAGSFLQQSPLSELCRALFNVNEFVYVD
ncbi:MAG: DUF1553 domain-containing protein [Gemmataceae bacterium]|nr:DUF1553 domain-containing protein [Gemmataceae bacterium]MDW8267175.1 DUF1553 domain-containing protein [Gemmataceae bacterium]